MTMVTLSIDPRDTVETAAAKRARVLESYGGRAPRGLALPPRARARVAARGRRGGFAYRFDRQSDQYAHPR